MKIGDEVITTGDPVAPILTGLAGKIVDIVERKDKTLYKICAENFGPFMPGPNGDRKVMAWKRGDTRKLEAKYIKLVYSK